MQKKQLMKIFLELYSVLFFDSSKECELLHMIVSVIQNDQENILTAQHQHTNTYHLLSYLYRREMK